MLEQERDFFNRSFEEWMKQFPGRVALVKGDKLIGVFDTDEDAITEGARQFGLSPFLVRRVAPERLLQYPPAVALGIVRGSTPSTWHDRHLQLGVLNNKARSYLL
jgi:hypothetical protein